MSHAGSPHPCGKCCPEAAGDKKRLAVLGTGSQTPNFPELCRPWAAHLRGSAVPVPGLRAPPSCGPAALGFSPPPVGRSQS